MPTTFSPENTLNVLISYLRNHPEIAQEMYEDIALGKSIAEVDNDQNPVVCELNSSEDINTYMSQFYAD